MQFDWHRLFEMYSWGYYTIPLLLLLTLYVAIKAATVIPPTSITRAITVYAAASALQNIFISVVFLYTSLYQNQYAAAFSIVLFMVIELACCYYLVKASGISHLQHRAMQLLLLLFGIYAGVYTCLHFFKGFYQDAIGLIQLPIMLLCCCMYYYNLIKRTPKQALLKQPLFWAIGGMCFVAMLLLPYSLVSDYLGDNKSTLPLFHLIPTFCYSILFFTHLKALQCSQQQP